MKLEASLRNSYAVVSGGLSVKSRGSSPVRRDTTLGSLVCSCYSDDDNDKELSPLGHGRPDFSKDKDLKLRAAVLRYNKAADGAERRRAETGIRKLLERETTPLRRMSVSSRYDDSWLKDLRRAPGSELRPANLEDLFKTLGIKPDSDAAKVLSSLVSFTGFFSRERGMTVAYLKEIAEHHGINKLISIAVKLLTFAAESRAGRLPQGIDAQKLVSDALRDLALPSAIDQGEKGTCAAAAIQGKLAAERPEQYVDMLLALAKDQTYRTPEGKEIPPNNSWKNDPKDSRRLSEKIMQNAIMNLRGRDYNSREGNDGMYSFESEDALEAVFGYKEGQLDREKPGLITTPKRLWRYIMDDLARGRPVAVDFQGHAVLVVGFDPTQNPKQVLISTWGSLHTMSLEQFLSNVVSVRHVDDRGLDNRKLPENRKTQVVDG